MLIRKGKVFGDIDAPKGNFVLEPCAAFKGCHVWKVILNV